MKKHKYTIFFLLFVTWANAQVAIGKPSITNTSVSLEFYDSSDNARGMLLPWASTVAGTPNTTYKGISSPVDGTLIFDISDEKVKYRKAGSWFDLTIKSKNDVISGITNANLTSDLSIQGSSLEDKTNSRAAIGANAETNTTDGVLVLTDINKAMILPKVTNPQTTIQSPSAGMIVYDTNKRVLCVFNGTVWTFWKP